MKSDLKRSHTVGAPGLQIRLHFENFLNAFELSVYDEGMEDRNVAAAKFHGCVGIGAFFQGVDDEKAKFSVWLRRVASEILESFCGFVVELGLVIAHVFFFFPWMIIFEK